MQTTMKPLERIWNLLKAEKSDITAIYFYAILSGLIQLSLPVGVQAIIGFVLGGTLSASLGVLMSMLVAGVFFAGLLHINQMKIIERIQQKIFVQYASSIAFNIPRVDLRSTDTLYLPELVNRFFDTESLQKGLSKLLLVYPMAMIQILFGLILLSFYHPSFILFGFVLIFLLWLILFITGNNGLQSSLTASKYKYRLAGWLEEMARMVNTFKFFSAGNFHLKKADEKTIGYLKARTTHFNVLLFQYRILLVFKVFITGALLFLGVLLLLREQINIGQFVAAEIIILVIINSAEKIIVNLDKVYDILTAIEKLGKLTDITQESSGSYILNHSKGLKVEAQNLYFGYDNAKPLLVNLSFCIPQGNKACITGNDGSGKSTLLKLLTGAYKNHAGSLMVNDIPLGNYNLDSLRDYTGILFPQENIFHGTLLENITMGKTGLDMEHIKSLTIKTGLKEFLAGLPGGFDTELDPTGKRLSKNVIQKILLVRAMAHKPKLLLLEEPWLGIEEQYKQEIQQMLLETKDATVIIAANDASFARRCDHIIHLLK